MTWCNQRQKLMSVKLWLHRFVSTRPGFYELQSVVTVMIEDHTLRSHQITPSCTTIDAHEQGPTKHLYPNIFACVQQIMYGPQLNNLQWWSLQPFSEHISKARTFATRTGCQGWQPFHCHNMLYEVHGLHVTLHPRLRCTSKLFCTKKIVKLLFSAREQLVMFLQVVT